MRLAITCAVAALLMASPLYAGGLSVIINKDNSVSSVSKAELKRIYTGRMTEWGKTKIVPVNLPLDSDEARQFLKTYVGMNAQEYREYWVAQQIKGAGTAPMIQKTADNVKAMVSQIPGAIGYMASGDVDDTVKAVPVK